jgi:hypothetical protein
MSIEEPRAAEEGGDDEESAAKGGLEPGASRPAGNSGFRIAKGWEGVHGLSAKSSLEKSIESFIASTGAVQMMKQFAESPSTFDVLTGLGASRGVVGAGGGPCVLDGADFLLGGLTWAGGHKSGGDDHPSELGDHVGQ